MTFSNSVFERAHIIFQSTAELNILKWFRIMLIDFIIALNRHEGETDPEIQNGLVYCQYPYVFYKI